MPTKVDAESRLFSASLFHEGMDSQAVLLYMVSSLGLCNELSEEKSRHNRN